MWDQGNGYLVVIFEGKEHVALATTNFLFGLKYVKECQSVQLCFETCNQCRLLYVKPRWAVSGHTDHVARKNSALPWPSYSYG